MIFVLENDCRRSENYNAPTCLVATTRGVEVLERIGNTEARALLTALSQGDPLSRAAQEATAALQRLKGK